MEEKRGEGGKVREGREMGRKGGDRKRRKGGKERRGRNKEGGRGRERKNGRRLTIPILICYGRRWLPRPIYIYFYIVYRCVHGERRRCNEITVAAFLVDHCCD